MRKASQTVHPGVGLFDQFIVANSHSPTNVSSCMIVKGFYACNSRDNDFGRKHPALATELVIAAALVVCDHSRTGRFGAYGCHAHSRRGPYAIEY
jgi:hypothetical protein